MNQEREDDASGRGSEILGAPLLEWHIKSTTKALNGLYEYDAVSRLRDSQLGDDRVNDIKNYIKKESSGRRSKQRKGWYFS